MMDAFRNAISGSPFRSRENVARIKALVSGKKTLKQLLVVLASYDRRFRYDSKDEPANQRRGQRAFALIARDRAGRHRDLRRDRLCSSSSLDEAETARSNTVCRHALRGGNFRRNSQQAVLKRRPYPSRRRNVTRVNPGRGDSMKNAFVS